MSIPATAKTGDSIIDEYLIDFDARLLGSGRVRVGSLLELGSHLLETRDALVHQGVAPAEASARAVQAMGDPEKLAIAQRASLCRSFGKAVLYMLIFSGVFNLMLDANSGFTLFESLMMRWPECIAVSLVGGWFVTFLYAMRAAPNVRTRSETFRVSYPMTYTLAAAAAIALLAAHSVACIATLLGLDVMDSLHLSSANALPLAVIDALVLLTFSPALLRAIDIDVDGFSLRGPLGRRQFSWRQVRRLSSITEQLPLLRSFVYWRCVYRLELENDNGTIARLLLWPDMVNSDVFAQRIREELASHKPKTHD